MADIELVIKIDEKDYKIMQHNVAINKPLCSLSEKVMVSKIAEGIPLPEGHGRIVDETKISKCKQVGVIIKDGNITRCFTVDAPTIIPADKR